MKKIYKYLKKGRRHFIDNELETELENSVFLYEEFEKNIYSQKKGIINFSYCRIMSCAGKFFDVAEIEVKECAVTNKEYYLLTKEYYFNKIKYINKRLEEEREMRAQDSNNRWSNEDKYQKVIRMYQSLLQDKMNPREKDNIREMFRIMEKPR